MAAWMQGAMDGATGFQRPYHQWGLAKMAEVLNYARGGDFLDWLYDGGGKMRVFVAERPTSATGRPLRIHRRLQRHARVALGPSSTRSSISRQLRPTVYPGRKVSLLSQTRRYHNVFDFSMDTVIIDRAFR